MAVWGGAIVLVVVLFWMGNPANVNPTVTDNPGELKGVLVTKGDWSNNVGDLAARLSQIGLPKLATEGSAMHIHQHLDLFVDGKQIAVPDDIGVGPYNSYISQIHTHDPIGIIHVESPTIEKFTLGQFFDVWGVKFTATDLGGNHAEGDKYLKVFSNGKLYEGDPRKLELTPYEEIVVAYGTDAQLPKTIPSTYTFPSGY